MELWRTDAFELGCWRRLLRVPWTARSNQSVLKEINPKYSLEGLILKLKLQYFGYLMQSWLTGKDPDARKDWQQEKKGATKDEMLGWCHWLNMSLSKLWEIVKDREAWSAEVHGLVKRWTQLSNWTIATPMFIAVLFTIARTWRHPRCSLTDEWINKFWYIYTMEYY